VVVSCFGPTTNYELEGELKNNKQRRPTRVEGSSEGAPSRAATQSNGKTNTAPLLHTPRPSASWGANGTRRRSRLARPDEALAPPQPMRRAATPLARPLPQINTRPPAHSIHLRGKKEYSASLSLSCSAPPALSLRICSPLSICDAAYLLYARDAMCIIGSKWKTLSRR
jgi:hypothetical protein